MRLAGFGSFKKRTRKARQGRNPKTGGTIQLPAVEEVQFTSSKQFKKLIN